MTVKEALTIKVDGVEWTSSYLPFIGIREIIAQKTELSE